MAARENHMENTARRTIVHPSRIAATYDYIIVLDIDFFYCSSVDSSHRPD
jgi:hypothetical protein